MKISPAINLPKAEGFQTNSDKRLQQQQSQDDEPKYTLSEFLDAKAQQYSDEDASFAGQYENLEKVYDNLEQKINGTARVTNPERHQGKLRAGPESPRWTSAQDPGEVPVDRWLGDFDVVNRDGLRSLPCLACDVSGH